jgi:cleavage stimulation factor subunit 3
MEWYVNDNAKVARKVFELGLKQYINEPAYVLEYLKLLEHLNDKNNMRVLFERVLASLPSEKAQEIWNKFLEFEYNFGDSESIEKVNQRRNEIYPDQSMKLIIPNNHFRYRKV